MGPRTRVIASLASACILFLLLITLLFPKPPKSGEFRGTEVIVLVDNNPSPSTGLESAWGLSPSKSGWDHNTVRHGT